jgi:UDP-N-acetylmuramate dehydrogenase
MTPPSPVPTLAQRTTLRVGGPAHDWIVAVDERSLVQAVRDADAAGTPVLLVGGGSNLLVADGGFPGTVIEIATRGLAAETDESGATVTIAAGENWDATVAHIVGRGWVGIEALSGIPGRAGATPVQNVGAYGQDVSQVVANVRVLDRTSGTVRRLDRAGSGFGYRTSVFKREPERYVVLSVTMKLASGGRGVVRYGELAEALGVAVGEQAPSSEIRAAVLDLRGRKGMVLDESDHDSWSAGSFFTNPVVDADAAALVPDACPRYPSETGVKLSAAWLIESSGIQRGFALDGHPAAAISGKHTLALTNRGGASAEDVLALARHIRATVDAAFGIRLEPEVRTVGCSL